jgi:sulfotransferase
MVYDEYMDKKYYFLSGLFRSGNTVLSAILNQNLDVYSSPLSPISGYMWTLHNNMENSENDKRSKDKTGQETVMKNLLSNYYSNIDKPTIIDREKQWPLPANFYLLKKYIDPNPKIIFTVRPMLEILLSLINILGKDLETAMEKDFWPMRPYLTLNDNKCDYLMQTGSHYDLITHCFISLHESPENFHIVEYDDIVNKPEDVMYGIYDFLGLPRYDHDFENIEKIEEDNDLLLGLPVDLHKIRPKLEKTSQDPYEVFSDYVIKKYGNLDFWKNIKK